MHANASALFYLLHSCQLAEEPNSVEIGRGESIDAYLTWGMIA